MGIYGTGGTDRKIGSARSCASECYLRNRHGRASLQDGSGYARKRISRASYDRRSARGVSNTPSRLLKPSIRESRRAAFAFCSPHSCLPSPATGAESCRDGYRGYHPRRGARVGTGVYGLCRRSSDGRIFGERGEEPEFGLFDLFGSPYLVVLNLANLADDLPSQSRREAFGIKQEFRHYHLRPTIRLQRYLLPLAEYVKRTPEDHPDRENAQEAMRIIREQCAACDAAVADAQLRLACKRYDRLIEKDGNYSVSYGTILGKQTADVSVCRMISISKTQLGSCSITERCSRNLKELLPSGQSTRSWCSTTICALPSQDALSRAIA